MSAADKMKHIMDHFRIGCDPELFLFNKKTKKLVSGHPYVKGTKAQPHPVNKGAVQLDGISAEFNIDPAASIKEFMENLIAVLEELRAMIPNDFDLVPLPAVNTGTSKAARQFFESLPDSVKELGCSPSFDIRNLEVTFPPDRPADHPYLFTGSGHIHVGFTQLPDDVNPMEDRAHLLDCYYLTLKIPERFYNNWSVSHLSRIRNQLYGKRWETRIKKYGVEIRYPNNYWLWDSPTMIQVGIQHLYHPFGTNKDFLDRWYRPNILTEVEKVRTLLGDPVNYM